MRTVSIATACVSLLLVVSCSYAPKASAAELTLEFGAPADGVWADERGDLVRLTVTIDDATGAYSASFIAAEDAPFSGNLRFDLRLTNLNLENYGSDIASLENAEDVVNLAQPVTSYTVSGVAPGLRDWRGGQHVRASSNGAASGVLDIGPPFQGVVDTLDPEAVAQLEPAPPSPAPHYIRIAFNGQFSACKPASACTGTELEALLDTEFSGVVLMPNIATDRYPDNPAYGEYVFENEAYMSFAAAGLGSDIARVRPVVGQVYNCSGAQCPFNADAMFVKVRSGEYDFYFGMGSPRPPFYTDAIPTIDELQTTYAVMEICTPDFAACIGTYTEGTITSPMQVEFAAIPRESAPVAHVRVPTMPHLLLVALALLLAALGLRAGLRLR